MSMCLYITSGPQRRMFDLARDQDALARLTMGSIVGRMRSLGAFREEGGAPAMPFTEMELSNEALEKQLDEMVREGWRQGILQGLYISFVKGQLREDLRQSHLLLQSFQSQMSGADARSDAASEGKDYIDLHKSWHVLHYLFTGTTWDGRAPANTLLKGGRKIGGDLGYGPARVVDPKTTQAFAAFLEPLSPDDLKARLDMTRMAQLQIYCAEDGDEMAEDELREDIDHCFPMLKDYVGAAAANGESLAIWMT